MEVRSQGFVLGDFIGVIPPDELRTANVCQLSDCQSGRVRVRLQRIVVEVIHRRVALLNQLDQDNRCCVPKLEEDEALLEDEALENLEIEPDLLAERELLELFKSRAVNLVCDALDLVTCNLAQCIFRLD